jgi:penicillin amidase
VNDLNPFLPYKRRLAMIGRTVRAMFGTPVPRTVPALRAELLPPMRGAIEILRDANGVPHIFADEEPDLYAALGYLQGADRFFVLDLVRHFGAGRLCDFVGNLSAPKNNPMFSGKGVKDIDQFVRPLNFEAQSRSDYERVSARGRACLDAYAAGINAALRAMRGVYPIEYVALGAIRTWHPADALLCAQTCAFSVQLSPLDAELAFDDIRGRLGDEATKRFFPEAPWENTPTSYANVDGPEPEPPVHLAASGSNNWAVSGTRSASGKPLFANDPHVPFFPLPTFWYHAHLDCPLYRIQGGLMLGCPIFGFGHNGHLAWGVTTAYRDARDLFRIHRLSGDATRYKTAAGTGTITKHTENHPTRWGKPTTLTWESCEHGIIYPGWKHHDGIDLALRHVQADLATYFDGYLALAQAASAADHQRALEQINEGPFDFNHVYAHKDGHIAWEPFGKLVRRPKDGLFVRDAHDPAGQWDGFLPFAENPKIINPDNGVVASANSIADPVNYRRSTTAVHVEPLHRQRRIESRLMQRADHSVDTFAALQSDIGTDYGPAIRDALITALAVHQLDDPARSARDLLQDWDGSYSVDAVGATICHYTMHALARRIMFAVLGETTGKRFINTRRAVHRTQRLLQDRNDPLHGDIQRCCGKDIETLAGDAFTEAVRLLAARYGNDPRYWTWGKVQRIRLGTLLAELPVVGRYFRAVDAPFPGDQYTVSPSISLPIGSGLRPFVGATSRFICDLARPDEGWFAHTSGPSADIGSTYYKGVTAAWTRFEYFRSNLWQDPKEIPNVTERLVIRNQKR